MIFAACLGNMTMVQAASVSEPSRTEQRAMLSESSFFLPGRLGQSVSLYGTGEGVKKADILSPGQFGTVKCTDHTMWSKNKNKKITWLSPGQFGEDSDYLS